MFIELHMIQNFAPSNLNRDDTGSPRTANSAATAGRAYRHGVSSAPYVTMSFSPLPQAQPLLCAPAG